MKKFSNAVDRFCALHPRFGIPNLMLYVVIANVIIWLFGLMDRSGALINALSFDPAQILRGQVWRLLTFALIPNSTGFLALIAFYFYYFIGSTIEREWGSGRFTVYFITGMLFTVIYGFILYFITGVSYAVTAEYIYLSMFFTFATLYPDMQVLLFFIIPIKMKWLGLVDAALFLYSVITTPFPFNLLPVVAVLNYLLFCGEWLLDLLRRGKARRSPNVIRFRSEVRRMEREQKNRPYTRRCEVCGRTDTDWPDLEFRYCSRCAGYHCFCMDHINNHRHFTQ
ncbi:MAG: hypothetical protein IJU29_06235 [Oscillospiraceae bacterium]|nr:hypothetical protein [Oscillospiraceae bacterium]